MAGFSERTHDCEVAALVGEELHYPLSGLCRFFENERFFVSERVGRISESGADIFCGQARIAIEEISLGGTLAEFSQDQLDGDARAANDRLPHHDVGIDLDPVRCMHATQILLISGESGSAISITPPCHPVDRSAG
jgi:hypothetical protein